MFLYFLPKITSSFCNKVFSFGNDLYPLIGRTCTVYVQLKALNPTLCVRWDSGNETGHYNKNPPSNPPKLPSVSAFSPLSFFGPSPSDFSCDTFSFTESFLVSQTLAQFGFILLFSLHDTMLGRHIFKVVQNHRYLIVLLYKGHVVWLMLFVKTI